MSHRSSLHPSLDRRLAGAVGRVRELRGALLLLGLVLLITSGGAG
ncbi:MAG TPA: hypothetical protein VGC30_10570 [Dokdonella sp.]